MLKKIYIGFSIDMDRAYPDNIDRVKNKEPCVHGAKCIYKNAHDFNHGKDFLNGMENIKNYMIKNNFLKGCTYLINEATFETTNIYPEMVEDIYLLSKKYNCEIGLHTHFESSTFKTELDGSFDEKKWAHCKVPPIKNVTGGGYMLLVEKDCWFKDGLVKPKKRIEDLIYNRFNEHYNVECFKAGGHMRNKEIIESLMETNFKYDCTCICEQNRIIEFNNRIYKLYDDTQIKLENGPFLIKNNNNKTLLEIPECQNYNKFRRSIKNMIKNNIKRDVYLLLQLHPYQCIDSLPDEKNLLKWIDKYISIVKEFYNDENIIFCNMKNMGDDIMKNKNYYEMTIDEFI